MSISTQRLSLLGSLLMFLVVGCSGGGGSSTNGTACVAAGGVCSSPAACCSGLTCSQVAGLCLVPPSNGSGNNGNGNNGNGTNATTSGGNNGNGNNGNGTNATTSGGNNGNGNNGNGTNATTSGGNNNGNGNNGNGTNATATTSGGVTHGTSGTTSGLIGTNTGGSTSGSGITVGSACTYDSSTGIDSCLAAGYLCSAQLVAGETAGTCVLPVDYAPCQASVGCQDGGLSPPLSCVAGFAANGGGTVSLCVQECTSSASCDIDPSSSCLDLSVGEICYTNYCDVDAGTDLYFSGPYYNTCNAAGISDGQCLSYATGAYATCLQNGTAASGAACSYDRGGPNPQCVFGQICVEGASDTSPYGNGICMPLAVTLDGGFPCDGPGDVALQYLSTDWAVCATGCSGPGGTCGLGMSCTELTSVPGSYVCLPE